MMKMKNKGKIKLFITTIVVASMLAHFLFGSVAASTQNENTEEVHTVEYGAKLIKDITEESNVLLVGHYAFDLNNPDANGYNSDNFEEAKASADGGNYYYKLGGIWYGLSLAEEHGFTEEAVVEAEAINGGIYYFWNMQGKQIVVVDRSALEAKIAEAGELLDYQGMQDADAIWEDLNAALKVAVEVADSDDISQEAIDEAVKALDSAIQALKGDTAIALAKGNHGIDWYLTRSGDLHWMGGTLKYYNYPWKAAELKEKVKTVIIHDKVQLPALSDLLFNGLVNLERIENAHLLDTSQVTKMNSMFEGLSKLTEIEGISQWDTSNVWTMERMFSGASSLIRLDLATNGNHWDTSKVENMNAMFSGASSLEKLNVSDWDTSSVKVMSQMFRNTPKLTTLAVGGWDTSSVETMSYMFYSDKGSLLADLDVSEWNTEKVTNMEFMFYGMNSLNELDVSDWKTGKVTTMNSMFTGVSGLTTLDVSSWNTSGATHMYRMFGGMSALVKLDVSGWNTSNVTRMDSMFYKASSLAELNVARWNTGKVTTMNSMFDGATSLETLTGTSSWNTSSVTDMAYLFKGTSSLTELDLSKWNASKVTKIGNMFVSASNLKTVDLSGWTIPSTDTYVNFYEDLFTHLKRLNSLETLNLSGWGVNDALETQRAQFKSPDAISLDVATDSE